MKPVKKQYPPWVRALIFLMFIPLAWLTFTALFGTMNLAYQVSAEGVHIKHSGALVIIPAEDILLPFAEIEEVRCLQGLPKLRKVWGKDGFGALVGDFKSDEYGDVKAYVREQKGPAVLIKTKNRAYIVSPKEAWDFTKKIQAGVESK